MRRRMVGQVLATPFVVHSIGANRRLRYAVDPPRTRLPPPNTASPGRPEPTVFADPQSQPRRNRASRCRGDHGEVRRRQPGRLRKVTSEGHRGAQTHGMYNACRGAGDQLARQFDEQGILCDTPVRALPPLRGLWQRKARGGGSPAGRSTMRFATACDPSSLTSNAAVSRVRMTVVRTVKRAWQLVAAGRGGPRT